MITPPEGLEFKTAVAWLPDELATDATPTAAPDDQGIVETLVAVTGIKDDVGDVIVPGAFKATLAARKPKVCLGHDWNRPIGRTLDIKEYLPGDSRLPKETAEGKPWPREAGAVWARYLANLATDDGKAAFHSAKFFGTQEATYSIGYKTVKAHHKAGVRYIERLDLFEYGPVLHPANRLATLQSIKTGEPVDVEYADLLASWEAVKSSEPEGMTLQDYSASLWAVETKARYVQDATFWGYPKGTLIRPGMKPRGKTSQALRRRGIVPSRNVGVSENPGDKRRGTNAGSIAINMGDEGLDLGLPEGGITSDARVRARNPKGKDEQHVSELADYLTPVGKLDDIARKEMDQQRDKALEGLLDEGITPDELRQDLADHPDLADAEVDPSDLEELLADYQGRYRALAAEQSTQRSAPKDEQDGGAGAAEGKPKPTTPKKPARPKAPEPGTTPVADLDDEELAAEKEQTRKQLLSMGNIGPAAKLKAWQDRSRELGGEIARRAGVDKSAEFAAESQDRVAETARVLDGIDITKATDRLSRAREDSAARTDLPGKRGGVFTHAGYVVAPDNYDIALTLHKRAQSFAEGKTDAAEELRLIEKYHKHVSGPSALNVARRAELYADFVEQSGVDLEDGGRTVREFRALAGLLRNLRQSEAAPDGEMSTDALIRLKRVEGLDAVKAMSAAELERHDRELTRRAIGLGRPDAVSPAHKAVKDELARKKKKAATAPAPGGALPEGAGPSAPDGPEIDAPTALRNRIEQGEPSAAEARRRGVRNRAEIALITTAQDRGVKDTGPYFDALRAKDPESARDFGRNMAELNRDPDVNQPEVIEERAANAVAMADAIEASGADLGDVQGLPERLRAWAEGLREEPKDVAQEDQGDPSTDGGDTPDPIGDLSDDDLAAQLAAANATMQGLDRNGGAYADTKLRRDALQAETERRSGTTIVNPVRDRAAYRTTVAAMDDDRLAAERARLLADTSADRAEVTYRLSIVLQRQRERGREIAANPPAPTPTPTPTPPPGRPTGDGARIGPDALDEAQGGNDEALGLYEAEDGELEVTPEVAERQDRLDKLLRDTQTGKVRIPDLSVDELTGTRKDLAEELRLQEAVRRRDLASGRGPVVEPGPTAPPGGDGGGGTATPTGPKRRPGVAGAAEDYADALDSGDTAEATRARARLESSLRRSRSDSPAAKALSDHLAATGPDDPAELRRLADVLKLEARDRRNASARARRKVKRLERDRLRSLLGEVDAALRGKGVVLPDDGRGDSRDGNAVGDGSTTNTRMIGGLVYTPEPVGPGQGEMWITTLPDGRTGGVNDTGNGWSWFIRGSGILDDRAEGFPDAETAARDMQTNAPRSVDNPRGVGAPDPTPRPIPEDPDLPPEDYAPAPPPVGETLTDLKELSVSKLLGLWEEMADVLPRANTPEADALRVAEGRDMVDAEYDRRGMTRLVNLTDGQWFTFVLNSVDVPVPYLKTDGRYVGVNGDSSPVDDWVVNLPIRRIEAPAPPENREYPPGRGGAWERARDALKSPTLDRYARPWIQRLADQAPIGAQISPDGKLAAIPDGNEWVILDISSGDLLSDGLGAMFDISASRMRDKIEDLSRMDLPWGDSTALRARWKDHSLYNADMFRARAVMNGTSNFRLDGVNFETDYAATKETLTGITSEGNNVVVTRSGQKWGWRGTLRSNASFEYDSAEQAAAAALQKERDLTKDTVKDLPELGKEFDRVKAELVPLIKKFSKSGPIFLSGKVEAELERSKELKIQMAEINFRYERVRKMLPAGQSEAFDGASYTPAVFGGTQAERNRITKMFRNHITKGLTARQVRALDTVQIAQGKTFSQSTTAADYSLGNHVMRIAKSSLEKSFTEDTKRMVESGWWAKADFSDGATNTVTHEYGHHMDSLLTRPQREAMFRELSDTLVNLSSDPVTPYSPGWKNANNDMWSDVGAESWVQANKQQLEWRVSIYSAHSQFEIIAELWTEFRGNAEPSRLAKVVGKHLMGALDGKPPA